MSVDVQSFKGRRPRIQVAAFGFKDPALVVNPIRLLDADVFFLLENPRDGARRHHMEKDGLDVHDRVSETIPVWEPHIINLWRPAHVAHELLRITDAFQGQRVDVNVSSGPNTVAVGATLASMFGNIQMFHPGGPVPSEPLQVADQAQWIPTFRVPRPNAAALEVLGLLAKAKKAMRGRTMKSKLKQIADGVFNSQEKERWQVVHNRFSKAVDVLVQLGAVERTKNGHHVVVEATQQGYEMAVMFGGPGDWQTRLAEQPTF